MNSNKKNDSKMLKCKILTSKKYGCFEHFNSFIRRILLQFGQYQAPSGAASIWRQSMWNHSIKQPGFSQKIILPCSGPRQTHQISGRVAIGLRCWGSTCVPTVADSRHSIIVVVGFVWIFEQSKKYNQRCSIIYTWFNLFCWKAYFLHLCRYKENNHPKKRKISFTQLNKTNV